MADKWRPNHDSDNLTKIGYVIVKNFHRQKDASTSAGKFIWVRGRPDKDMAGSQTYGARKAERRYKPLPTGGIASKNL